MIHLDPAVLGLSPAARVHDEASTTDIETASGSILTLLKFMTTDELRVRATHGRGGEIPALRLTDGAWRDLRRLMPIDLL